MPKPIKLTQDWIEKMIQEFAVTLGGLKLSDGKVSYTKTLSYEKEEEGVTIMFEPVAYAKMLTLIHSFTTEVAWHGIVERIDQKVFVIKDLLVYPQQVAGGTVTTDQERYQDWLYSLDDETFNAVRMQGHSHVSFSTRPSTVDEQFYDSILAQLTDEDFYIFMIFNKSLEHTVKVYDMKNNIMYEDKDVQMGIMCDGGDLEQFIADAKKDAVAVVSTYAAKSTTTAAAKDTKKKEAASPVRNNLSQYPGFYGYCGGYDYDGVDFDEEIFGKKDAANTGKKGEDWWNK